MSKRLTDPQGIAKEIVFGYAKDHLDKSDNVVFTWNDVYVVWFCFILGGWKALVSTSLPDGMYYEVTHNKEKNETYLDAYKKHDNQLVTPEMLEQIQATNY